MTRGHGWAFLDLGRRLERGMFTAELMEAVLRSGPDLELLLEPALEIGDSVMTHRRRYFAEPRPASALEVLVRDPTNNRLPSMRHITTAWGRDYSDVSPIRGVLLGSGGHTLSVALDVVPLGPLNVAT